MFYVSSQTGESLSPRRRFSKNEEETRAKGLIKAGIKMSQTSLFDNLRATTSLFVRLLRSLS